MALSSHIFLLMGTHRREKQAKGVSKRCRVGNPGQVMSPSMGLHVPVGNFTPAASKSSARRAGALGGMPEGVDRQEQGPRGLCHVSSDTFARQP